MFSVAPLTTYGSVDGLAQKIKQSKTKRSITLVKSQRGGVRFSVDTPGWLHSTDSSRLAANCQSLPLYHVNLKTVLIVSSKAAPSTSCGNNNLASADCSANVNGQRNGQFYVVFVSPTQLNTNIFHTDEQLVQISRHALAAASLKLDGTRGKPAGGGEQKKTSDCDKRRACV